MRRAAVVKALAEREASQDFCPWAGIAMMLARIVREPFPSSQDFCPWAGIAIDA